jgi:hypothetical protein
MGKTPRPREQALTVRNGIEHGIKQPGRADEIKNENRDAPARKPSESKQRTLDSPHTAKIELTANKSA